MASLIRLCCLSQPISSNDTCRNCKILKLVGVNIIKPRWNTGVFKLKCDHGPHTEHFYLSMEGYVAISEGGRKHSADANLIQTTPKRRAQPDYKEKYSNELKVVGNLYPAGYYNYNMEGVNFDYLSDVPIPDVIHCGRGRPAKVANYCSTARFKRRCQKLTVMMAMADNELL
jgi:hypothetical protein